MSGTMIIISILLPVVSGLCAAFALKRNLSPLMFRLLVWTALIGEGVCIFLAMLGEGSFRLFSPLPDIDFLFKIDELSKVFAGLVAVVWLLAGIYACEYMADEARKGIFFCFYLIAEGMIAAICFAGNIITFYMFFELMTVTTFPLVMFDRTKEAIRAGLKYLFYSIAGAFMTLFGIFMLMPVGILGLFKPGGNLDIAMAGAQGQMFYVSVILILVGLGTKAGMFPMHAWLPAAHPEAPAPASAVLSGVITKTGVFGIIRVIYYCTGTRLIAGTWVHITWMILTLFTVLMGSMLAYREQVLKKRLAYSTVSQVSYILFGLSMMNSESFTGAVSHVIFHSLIKTTLFLVAGVLIHQTGCTRVDEYRGAGRKYPITMWCYTIVSLGLIGIPPLSGFVSKWHLASGSLMSGREPYSWIGPVVLLVSALLTAGYLLPITIHGFFPGKEYAAGDHEVKAVHGEQGKAEDKHGENARALHDPGENKWMWIPMALMSAATVVLGVWPSLVTDIIEKIANMIM